VTRSACCGKTAPDATLELRMTRPILVLAACLGLGACAGQGVGLRDLSINGSGPDEFSVLPSRPLEIPQNLDTLPPPAPGAGNRADRYPVGEGIAALGGDPAASLPGPAPSADAALIAEASRSGVAPGIRRTLAAEDAQFRARRSGWGGWFSGGDRYYRAYASQSLNADAELERFRRAGIPVPSAPPPER